MRMESGALISENIKLRGKLEIAERALKFYSDQKHFDIVTYEPTGQRLTRIIDNGGMAEDALAELAL